MQEFFIGQKFYYILPETGDTVFAELKLFENDYLYLKDAYNRVLKGKKYYVGRSVFLVTKSTEDYVVGQKFYRKVSGTNGKITASIEKIEGEFLYLRDNYKQLNKINKKNVGRTWKLVSNTIKSKPVYNKDYFIWQIPGDNEEYLSEQEHYEMLGNIHKNSEDGAGVEREIPEFKLKK